MIQGFGSLTPLSTVSSDSGKPGIQNQEKVEKWKRDDAKVRYTLRICLNDFDNEDVAELTSARGIWERLRKKYTDTRDSTSTSLLARLTTYKKPEDMSIRQAWGDIQRLRRQLKDADAEMALVFKEDKLFRIFLASLPLSYSAIRDTLATTEISVDNKLRRLKDKEDELLITDTQVAMVAKDNSRPRSRRRASSSSSRSPPRRRAAIKCFLCEGRHSFRECPDLDYA